MSRSATFSDYKAAVVPVLVDLRKRAGISQVKLAERIAKPQSYISKLERGERRLGLLEFLEIAAALEADPHELLDHVRDHLTSLPPRP